MKQKSGEPGKPINSSKRIPTQPFSGQPEHDLTGRSFSGLFVVGYYGRQTRTHRGSQWVVRCRCGRYEVRRSQALKKQDPAKKYFCSACESLINKANHEEYLNRSKVA